jgi:hypothetical protein
VLDFGLRLLIATGIIAVLTLMFEQQAKACFPPFPC